MCIDCAGESNASSCASLLHSLQPPLSRRGPDYSKHMNIPLNSVKNHLRLCACTLRMRGPPLVEDALAQPLTYAHGRAFLWNGEIFGGLEVEAGSCDTDVLFAALSDCRSDNDILSTLKSVKGPYAFLYFDPETESLWFGRDFFGRRSLLWCIFIDNEDKTRVILSSVGETDGACDDVRPDDIEVAWQEVPAKGIFKMNLRSLLAFAVFDKLLVFLLRICFVGFPRPVLIFPLSNLSSSALLSVTVTT